MQKQISEMCRKGKSLILTIRLQLGYAGLDVLAKVALNDGMSSYVFVVYCHASAFIVMVPFAIVLGRSLPPSLT
ncbi:hypothetical protein HanHA300_Chr11g0421531 [Helianthus annuus]|nr:hypothetical protein HanHA300_Chr11g0421531 [Helianthus annuus]KAJ0519159.1 hypothetical protein HanHA89_Chr11g0445671 [Helianthus annuus]